MRRVIVLAFAAGLLTGAVGSVGAQTPTADRPEARELARLMFTSGLFDAVMFQAVRAATTVVKTGLEGRIRRELGEDEGRMLEGVLARTFAGVFPQPEWEELYAGLMAKHFSDGEMRELLGFYRTPLGAKALKLSDILTREGAEAGERLVKSREKAFAERFASEFARALPSLSSELERTKPLR